MARVVVVLDDIFDLPVTSGAVGVMEGRFASGDALCRPHHPLESLAVEGSAVAVPGCNTVRLDALESLCTHHRQTEMVHPHRHCVEEGATASLQPQEAE